MVERRDGGGEEGLQGRRLSYELGCCEDEMMMEEQQKHSERSGKIYIWEISKLGSPCPVVKPPASR